MGDRRTVLDDKNPLATNRFGIIEADRGRRQYDWSPGVDGAQSRRCYLDIARRRSIRFVENEYISHARGGLTRMMTGDLTRAQRIRHDDVEIGPEKRKIVVAAIPYNDADRSPSH
jgi:hypothetical protein